jgi:hypothetical protein
VRLLAKRATKGEISFAIRITRGLYACNVRTYNRKSLLVRVCSINVLGTRPLGRRAKMLQLN